MDSTDFDGLCRIDVRVAHYRGPHGNQKDWEKRSENPPSCSLVGYVGCGANQLNDAAMKAGQGVPKMPRNDGEAANADQEAKGRAEGLKPNDYTYGYGDNGENRSTDGDSKDLNSQLDSAIASAKAEAAQMCQDKPCCKKEGGVTINITCGPDHAGFSFDSRCGTTINVSCGE